MNKKELLKQQLMTLEKCQQCCVPVGYPNVSFIKNNDSILCSECSSLLSGKSINRVEETRKFLDIIKNIKDTDNKYHAVFAYSGGKDSTVALYSAVKEYKLKLLVYNFDNGFKGERVKQNINSVISDLNVDFYQTRSTTSDTIIQDINNSIIPCGRCSSLKRIYPELAKMFNVQYIITGIESVFNNEVIRDRGTFYQINWPAALNWTKKEIDERIKAIPWKNPNYGVFDSDCLCPIISLRKIYMSSQTPNIDMYYGKKEQHVVPYYSRLLRYGAITKDEFFEIICSELIIEDSLIFEYSRIAKRICDAKL